MTSMNLYAAMAWIFIISWLRTFFLQQQQSHHGCCIFVHFTFFIFWLGNFYFFNFFILGLRRGKNIEHPPMCCWIPNPLDKLHYLCTGYVTFFRSRTLSRVTLVLFPENFLLFFMNETFTRSPFSLEYRVARLIWPRDVCSSHVVVVCRGSNFKVTYYLDPLQGGVQNCVSNNECQFKKLTVARAITSDVWIVRWQNTH